jgi:hypothetical protein
MISVGFARVSKKRPCRICGKPTYCGFSRDEGTSICMRISADSRGLSRNGGNIHVNTKIPFITVRPTIKRPISQSVPPACLEIRDAVFQELIRISPASNYMEELVAQKHLYTRALPAKAFWNLYVKEFLSKQFPYTKRRLYPIMKTGDQKFV